jgi:glycosyltransferase involved in cell wall biosynthesis/O-antigen/teichoic acid export membrane protein
LIPVYWLLISIAAVKAFYQLLVKPYYWEKTHHGLEVKAKSKQNSKPLINFDISLPQFAFSPRQIFNEVGSAGTLVIVAMLVNGINFIYSSYLGHSKEISLAEFGLISLVGSLFSIIQIPQGGLSRAVNYRSAYLLGRYSQVSKQYWSYIRKHVQNIALIVSLIFLLLTPVLPRVFGTDSYLPFLIFSPILLISTLGSVDIGFLQGNAKFGILAVMFLIEALGKLLLTVVFINVGLANLVYSAIPLSTLFSYFVGRFTIKSLVTKEKSLDKHVLEHFPKRYFANSVLVSLTGLSFLSLDIILAKIYLNPDQAGQYALVSLIGKMVYFAGTTFSQFIVPFVSRAEGAGRNSRSVFYILLSITGLATAGAATVMGILGRYSAPILFGEKALSITGYLPLYCFAISFFTLGNAVVYYHQIRHQYSFGYIGFLLAIIQVFALSIAHQNLSQFIEIMFVMSFIYAGMITALHAVYSIYPNFKFRNFFKAVIPTAMLMAFRTIYWTDPNLKFRTFFKGLITSKKSPQENFSGLRILIFNWRDTKHVWAGGAEVYIHELSKRWVKMGHKVTIFCGNDGKNKVHEIIDGVEVYRRGGFFMVYFWAPIYYIFKFRRNFDLVVDSENGVPFFTPLFSRIPKFLLIHHVHQNVFREHLKFPLSVIAIFMEGKFMPFVYRNQKIITVSQSSREDIINLGLSTPEKISVVNPGIDLSNFHPTKKTSYPSFLYLGRIRQYKNIDVAIRSFKDVVKKFPAAKLYIAGWGETLNELKYITEKLNLGSSVIFLGRVSEKDKLTLMSSSWAMVQPSSFEGWGITVIEANACGTPVIASNVAGLRDSVVNGRTGILVKVRDIGELSQAMNSLIIDVKLKKRLSQEAITWSTDFDWDKQSRTFLKQMVISLPEGINLHNKYSYAETN